MKSMNARAKHPLIELTLGRLRLFFREPSTVFWAFGFPILLSIALGVAFRNRPPEAIRVAIQDGARASQIHDQLEKSADVKAEILSAAEAAAALRVGRAALVVVPGEPNVYTFDPTRPESRLARAVVDDALQRAAGRADAFAAAEKKISEPGSRYIDFLLPGIIGVNIMSSGMWGIGYVIVETRTRKLLKRMLATPMKKSHFLLSFVAMRLFFLAVELPVLLLFGVLAFSIELRGSIALFSGLALLGALAFAGTGLLVASRAQNTETVGGLINLVMMPMFIGSGVFFSTSNFPDSVQPLLRALPLTALNDALRAVMNEGAGLAAVAPQIGVLCAVAVLTFGVALRIFRWS
jgi:ABC-2 type transport system permease protein